VKGTICVSNLGVLILSSEGNNAVISDQFMLFLVRVICDFCFRTPLIEFMTDETRMMRRINAQQSSQPTQEIFKENHDRKIHVRSYEKAKDMTSLIKLFNGECMVRDNITGCLI
jgi:hypothetical protein